MIKVLGSKALFATFIICALVLGSESTIITVGAKTLPYEGPALTHISCFSIDNCTAVGSNSVVMPNNHIPEGTVIGAMSFVPAAFPFEPWSVYAGSPVRLVGRRNREVMTQAKVLRDRLVQLRAHDR